MSENYDITCIKGLLATQSETCISFEMEVLHDSMASEGLLHLICSFHPFKQMCSRVSITVCDLTFACSTAIPIAVW